MLPTQPLRDEHQELYPHVEALRNAADAIGVARSFEIEALVDQSYSFLVGHLVPHAKAEEAALYPAVEEAMGAPGATDTMSRDHVEVVRLTEALGGLRGSGNDVEIRRLLYELHGIVALHFAKEEEIYLPLLDGWLTPEAASELFRRLEAAAGEAKTEARA